MTTVAERRLISAWVSDNRQELLSWTQDLLRIPSVLDPEDSGPGRPFGSGCARVLDRALEICEQKGMRVRNFDGYAGHAEFGPEDAPEYVGVLGHLDVVPPGSGWSKDPWGGEVSDGWIWGRGSLDDKGPTMAALSGALAVKELGLPMRHRVRVIFGCDEENDWRCMAHYFGTAGQPQPKYGFTPDAMFPLVFAEKGALTAVLQRPSDAPWLLEFQSGLAANMVPAVAEALVANDLTYSTPKRGNLVIEPGHSDHVWRAIGKSAHGAVPSAGRNAAVALASALVSSHPSEALSALIRIAKIDGSGIGLAGSDSMSGKLTLNLGKANLDAGTLTVVVNIRFPATWNAVDFERRFHENVQSTGWTVSRCDVTPSLYVPVDAEPVRTLMKVFRSNTGSRALPKAMGGRTYATVMQPNGVAFGPSMPGDESRGHQPDERFAVDRFLECCEIYGSAVAGLVARVKK